MLAITPIKQAQPRLPGLDYLRGLSAFGIMLYHYSSWTFGEQEADSFLGRIGIYGVAIFYILSGLALSYVYRFNLNINYINLFNFYKKRFFRIFPLLWLATGLSILLSKHIPDGFDVLLNLTGLFGFFRRDSYFATGAWSIGNELCFYLIFPFFISLLNNYRVGFFLLASSVICICGVFAFKVIQPAVLLSHQWHNYTNPLNQLLFFLGGATIGTLTQPNAIKTETRFLLGAVGLLIFLLIPAHGNVVVLVTGIRRFLFIVSCFLICYSFFGNIPVNELLSKPFLLLGQISYSLYLLHPLIYNINKVIFSFAAKFVEIHIQYQLISSIIISLIISYISYNNFELFFLRKSR